MRTRLIYLLSASIIAVILSGCGQSDGLAQRKPQAQQNRAHTTGAQNNTGTTAPAVAPSLASELPDSATGVMKSVPGKLFAAGWLAGGRKPNELYTVPLSKTFVLRGVTWRVPDEVANGSTRIMVVPAVVNGKGYIVWCELPLIRQEHTMNWYPAGSSQLWMTPWRPEGGSLTEGAVSVMNDIPPLWSTTGDYLFPNNLLPKQSMLSQDWAIRLTSGAWTGWVYLGNHKPVYDFSSTPLHQTDTIAVPVAMWPTKDGVVVKISAHLMGANQGGSENLYEMNLASRHVYGIASLTSGGGTFSDYVVGTGAVYVQESDDLSADGKMNGENTVFDEVNHRHYVVPFWESTHGRPTVDVTNRKVIDKSGKVRFALNLPNADVTAVSPTQFPSGSSTTG